MVNERINEALLHDDKKACTHDIGVHVGDGVADPSFLKCEAELLFE